MAQTRRLYRRRTNRKLAGVCGGLAQYFNIDATPNPAYCGRGAEAVTGQRDLPNRCRVQASGPCPCMREDVMPARKRWSDLCERTRRLLITAATADGIFRVAALMDIKRRPASQIRGQKRMWAMVVAAVSSAGSCQSHTSSSVGGGRHVRSPTNMRGRAPYSTQVQQRHRPRTTATSCHRTVPCPNDRERPRRQEFASGITCKAWDHERRSVRRLSSS
jgi:PspC domain